MSTEPDFLHAIEARPFDEDVRLVFADWLEEQGDPRAELIRIQHVLRRIDVPDRAAVERRMHALLDAGVEPLVVTRKSPAGPLVAILPGEFVMGSPPGEHRRSEDEKLSPTLVCDGFWLGRTVVIQSKWYAITGTQPWKEIEGRIPEGPEIAAVDVDWSDAVAFCEKLTGQQHGAGHLPHDEIYRLPAEFEWEYACWAGTTTAYSFGDDPSLLEDFAWYLENTWGKTSMGAQPVARKKANAFGLFDMHGNVSEWRGDEILYESKQEDDQVGATPERFAVLRGGNWFASPWECRSASRDQTWLPNEGPCWGFRVVLSADRKL